MAIFEKLPYTNYHNLNADWIVKKVNEVAEAWTEYRENMNEWKDGVDTELQTFYNWFNNLDLTDEVRTIINEMVQDGSFMTAATPVITSATETWLAAHVSQGYAVDNTLTISGAAADAKATGDKISQLKEDLNESYKGSQYLNSNNWIIGLLIDTVGQQATINTAFTNRTACNETFVFDREIKLNLSSGYRSYVVTVDDSDIVLTSTTLFSGGAMSIIIPANTKFRVGVQKDPLETVSDITPYTKALTFNTEIGETVDSALKNALSIQDGFYPTPDYEIGGINSSGLKNTDTKCIRTKQTIKFDKDIYVRCNDEEYFFNAFEYSGKEITTNNYVGFSGSQYGTYKLKANTFYVLTVIKRVQETVVNIGTYASKLNIWSPSYTESKKQNTAIKFAPFANSRPKVICHRGNTSENPENTIPAFEAAGSGGCWGIETDVNMTYDGYLVCIHDTTLDRTTNGTGNVADKTLAEIEALHIKDHADLKVPTLEEFLTICKIYNCVAVIELKNMATNQDMVSKLINTILNYGLYYKTIITCSDVSIGRVQCIADDIPCLFNINPTNFDSELAKADTFFNTNIAIDVNTYTITKEMINKAHNKGMCVVVYQVNAENGIKEYIGNGVDIVSSDIVSTY